MQTMILVGWCMSVTLAPRKLKQGDSGYELSSRPQSFINPWPAQNIGRDWEKQDFMKPYLNYFILANQIVNMRPFIK